MAIHPVARKAVWFLAIAAGVIGLVLLVLHSGPVREYALKRGQDYLESAGIRLEAENLRYTLLTGAFSIDNLQIRSVDTPAPPFLTARHVWVDLALLDLLGGLVHIEEGEIDGLAIQYEIDEQGNSNLPQQAEPEPETGEPAGGPSVLVESLRVGSGSFSYSDRSRNLSAELPAWSLAVDGNEITLSHELEFQTRAPGTVSFEGETIALEAVAFEGSVDSNDVTIENFDARTGAGGVTISGEIREIDNPILELDAAFDADTGQVVTLLDVEQPLRGQLSGDVEVRGALDDLNVAAQIRSEDLEFGNLDNISLEADSSWSSAQQQLDLSNATVQSPAGNLQLNGTVATGETAGESRIDARFNRIDLRTIARQFDAPVQLASRASGTADARWPGTEFDEATGSARVNISASRESPAANLVPLSGSLSVKSENGRITLNMDGLRALATRFEGVIEIVNRERLQGKVSGDIPSLAELLSGIGTVTGREEDDPLMAADVEGQAEVEASLGGTVSNPEIQAAIDARNVQAGGITDATVAVRAGYSDDRITLPEASITWSGQTIAANGTVGLAGESPALDLEAQARAVSISDLLSGFGSQFPAEGTFDLTAKINGTVAAPSVDSRVTASGLAVYGEQFGSLEANAAFENQTVEVSQLRLSKPSAAGNPGLVQASGSYNLESREYALSAEADSVELTKLELPDAPPVHATIGFTASGEGNVDNPQLQSKLTVRDLTVGDQLVGPVDAALNLSGSTAEFDASASRFNLAVKGEAGVSSPYPAEVEISANKLDLATLPITGQETKQLTGTVSANVQASGELENWRQGTLEARITDINAHVDEFDIRTEGDLALRVEDRNLTIEPAKISLEGSVIAAEGSIPLGPAAPAGDLTLNSDLDLDSLVALVPTEQPMAAQGRLAIDASLRGTFQNLTPAFEARLENGAFFSPAIYSPLFEMTAAIALRNGRLGIEKFSAEWAGADVSAEGELPVGQFVPAGLPIEMPREDGPARLTVDVDGLVIDSLSDLPREAGGDISLHAELTAPRLEPDSIRAEVRFDEMRFNYKNFDIEQQQPVTLSWENGRGSIDQFLLTGPNTEIRADGAIDWSDNQRLNLSLTANTDLALLALTAEDLSATGPMRLDVAVNGSLDDPEVKGFAEISEARIDLATPPIQVTNLNSRVNFNPERLEVESISGSLNGGSLKASGNIAYSGATMNEVNLDVAGDDIFMNYPEGLRTVSDVDIQIRPREDLIVAGGEVSIEEGAYTESVEISEFLFDYLRGGAQVEIESAPNPLLSRVRYEIDINTAAPLVVDNNLAELAAEADLRLVGSYYRPGMTGRVTLREGGTLNLAENRYIIDRGIVDFTNEARIQPSVDIIARTEVGSYDIELQVTGGGPERITTTLTSPSHPELPEPDLMSLLLTGRLRENLRGEEINVAAEQSLSLLTGRLGSSIARGAQQALGLSQVRIDPNLIAPESDPGARLTVGQDLTDRISLTYSMDLVDSSDQIWIAEYDVTRRFMTQAIKQPDNTYRLELRHDLRFGGAPGTGRVSAGARQERPIGSIRFQSDAPLSEEQLLDTLDIESGEPYNFFEVHRGVQRLSDRLAESGYLEAKVQADRNEQANSVDLIVEVETGPVVEFIYEGWQVPGDVREQVRASWRRGVFDSQRADDAALAIQRFLVEQDYLKAQVEHAIQELAGNRKRVLFEIASGARYRNAELAFAGNSAFGASQLREQIAAANMTTAVYTQPGRVIEFLEEYYRANGYLDAAVDEPRDELDPGGGGGQVVIPIKEGPLYRIAEIDFRGNSALSAATLLEAMGDPLQGTYRPEFLREALTAIEERYWREGYNNVQVEFDVNLNEEQGAANIAVNITENQKGVVERIEVAGNHATSENLVRTQLGLDPGDTLNYEQVGRGRRNLYRTGAYSLVDIEPDPINIPSRPGEQPLAVRVKVREVQPYQLRYGGFFDTERGPGGIIDFSNRNSLGSARVIGFRTRYDADLKEARTYFSQPLLRRFPLESAATAFLRRELQANFITDRIGFSLLQETRWKDKYLLNYGYRFENAHTFEREPDPLVPFDVRLNVAPLTASFSRESRDDFLDSTRGSFWSNATEYAFSSLGSDLRFAKYFGQYFKYIPLREPEPIPFQGALRKSRLVYATGVRVGLASGLGGQVLVPSERFFAGGGTSVRGFEQDTLGPVDFEGTPIGGNAVFILNNELRFPLFNIFDGVAFVDIGNVYPAIGDFDPFNVRKTGGLGLRVRTPYFLLRADYGLKLDRRNGESAGAFFFSIGQAF